MVMHSLPSRTYRRLNGVLRGRKHCSWLPWYWKVTTDRRLQRNCYSNFSWGKRETNPDSKHWYTWDINAASRKKWGRHRCCTPPCNRDGYRTVIDFGIPYQVYDTDIKKKKHRYEFDTIDTWHLSIIYTSSDAHKRLKIVSTLKTSEISYKYKN